MAHYARKHTGTMLGHLTAAQSITPLLLILIYNNFFTHGHYDDPINQDVGGYLFLLALLFGVFNLLGIFFYFPPEEEEEGENGSEKPLVLESEEKCSKFGPEFYIQTCVMDPPNKKVLSTTKGKKPVFILIDNYFFIETKPGYDLLTVKDLLSSLIYHCVLWPCVFLMAIYALFSNNVTIILTSFGLEQYSAVIPLLSPAYAIVGKVALGLLADKAEKYINKAWYVIIASLLSTLGAILCMFFLEHISYITIALFLFETGTCAVQVISTYTVIQYFGMKNFPVAFGFMFGIYPLILLVFQTTFGVLYDNEIEDPSSTECYGLHCYTYTFIMIAFFGFFSFLMSLYILFDQRKNDRNKTSTKTFISEN